MDDLFVCIMAGGSGERFWPLSRQATPKHLLRLFSDRTLVQETVARVGRAVPADRIFILTNEAQLEATRQAVPELPVQHIIAEPAKRDTAPACALGTALVRSRNPRAVVAFLPADHVIRDAETFARQLTDAAAAARDTGAFLTFSIRPDHPSTGFGYLEQGAPVARPDARTAFFEVKRFVEKPDEATARQYVDSGRYGWNAGMFLWTTEAFLAEARRVQPELAAFIEGFPAPPADYAGYLRAKFPGLPKISVDYAIMEKASRVLGAKAAFDWDDVGTWTALPAHMGEDEQGNTRKGHVVVHDGRNNIVVAGKRMVALCGVSDLVVVETEDAVLVCHRAEAQNLKKLQAQLPEELR